MKYFYTVLVVFLLVQTLIGQEEEVHYKIFKVWVETMDGLQAKGFLTQVDSTGITIAPNHTTPTLDTAFYAASSIRSLKLRRKGSAGKGAAMGCAIGIGLGVLANVADDDTGVAEDGIESGIVVGLGVIGTGLGAFAGSGRKKYQIDGKETMYYLKIPLILEQITKK